MPVHRTQHAAAGANSPPTSPARRNGTAPGLGASPARRPGVAVLGMVNLGSIPGDSDEVTVSTTDPAKVTVWLGAAGATDLTRKDAEELAALLLRAVRQLGG